MNDNEQISAPVADGWDDFVPTLDVPKACKIDDPECEACQ